MNELALFAGAGGGILGGKLLGWRTVCAVEWEAYPASVLCARQNDGLLESFPIWDDVQTFDGKPWEGIVDVISGGFPCQDISQAGKGAGIDGERSGMWREMARIIGEVRPKYVFVENSPMLTSRGLGTVLGDLVKLGFDAEWGVLGADDVGAPHIRKRIWIVAKRSGFFSHAQLHRIRRWEQQQESIEKTISGYSFGELANSNGIGHLHGEFEINTTKNGVDALCDVATSSKNVANTSSIRQQGQGKHEQSIHTKKNCKRKANYVESIGSSYFWSVEPNVGRVADGVADRMDRLKAIGNGQVPLCAATAWRVLSDRLI